MRRAAALAALASAAAARVTEEYVTANSEALWATFKRDHNRAYASASEEATRRAVFVGNMREAARLNALDATAEYGATRFSDLTESEFKVYHNLKVPARAARVEADDVAAPAANIDWRNNGAVTQVKDQGQCGSCWSFSTTGGIEGAWKVSGHSLVSLSEQELVSCDKGDDGCQGGLMDTAFSWVRSKGGIATEASYPYTSGAGSVSSCRSSGSTGASISGYRDVGRSESSLASALQGQPISIAVDASTGWQSYRGGIMSSCRGSSLDHGVLLVGMTSEAWIVKNSWNAGWGESGYIRLARGSNQCGLTNSASYPTAGSGPAPPTPPGPTPPYPPPYPPPTPPSSGCSFSGGCQACGMGCYQQYGYQYYCCYGSSCCCYSGPANCNIAPQCPLTGCGGGEMKSNTTACRATLPGVAEPVQKGPVQTKLAKL